MVKRAMLVAALLGAACDQGFETRSIVLDLRVLTVRADPPEIVLDIDLEDPGSLIGLDIPPVELTLLTADPAGPARIAYQIDVCPPTDSHRCDDPTAPIQNIASGVSEDPDHPASDPIRAVFTARTDVLAESVRLDDLAGFGGIAAQVHIILREEGDDDPDHAVHAGKIVLYSPREPPERVANSNPSMEATLLGPPDAGVGPIGDPIPRGRCDGPGGAEAVAVGAGDIVRLEPLEAEGARESYVLPTFDGGTRTIVENLSYTWYATAGDFSSEQTGGPIDPFGNDPPLYTEWTAPADAGETRLWVVQRDERGGISWAEHCFEVGATP